MINFMKEIFPIGTRFLAYKKGANRFHCFPYDYKVYEYSPTTDYVNLSGQWHITNYIHSKLEIVEILNNERS